MHDVVRFGKLISDPRSLRVLNMLRKGQLCKCEIDAALAGETSYSTAVLKKLVHAGLVRESSRSLWRAYEIDPAYSDLIETVFEAFEEDVHWNPTIVHDEKALEAAMARRVDDWCKDPRDFSNYGRHKRKAKSGERAA